MAQALYQEEVAINEETEVTIPLFSAFACPEVYYAPNGSITISDPVETHYQLLPPGFDPVKEAITVALESSAIRSIAGFVDNHHRLECILDPGCQVITMSAIMCNKLGLAYNPSIRLNITFSPYSTFTPPYFHYNYLILKGHMAIHAATILTRFLISDSSFLLSYMTHIDYDSYSTYINQ